MGLDFFEEMSTSLFSERSIWFKGLITLGCQFFKNLQFIVLGVLLFSVFNVWFLDQLVRKVDVIWIW